MLSERIQSQEAGHNMITCAEASEPVSTGRSCPAHGFQLHSSDQLPETVCFLDTKQSLNIQYVHCPWKDTFDLATVGYWAPTNLGRSSFGVVCFCLFVLLMGFSRQEYWSGLPLPSPVDHVLSELFTMACPHMAWLIVSLRSLTLWSKWSVWLVFCNCGFHSVCPLMEKDRRLMEASWWKELAAGESGLALMGGAKI